MHKHSRTHSLIANAALALALTAAPAAMVAQHADGAALVTKAPKEADQFAFLIGQWSTTITPQATSLGQKIHGVRKLHGTWRAWRALDGWGIADESRVVDASGNPMALTQFVRVYDAAAKRWNVVSVDAYRGKVTSATAELKDGVFTSIHDGTDADGKSFLSRTRFEKITPNSFVYTQARSYDGGKNWDDGVLTIEGKRTSATAER
ncbi:MAG TPA: hypothetical protein VGQ30_12480 [Gemmatimonadaceae bacterium]|jgi:hypothetical protein|nr:hypothetical protein [Gemmatimonadaceae bacterium]